MEQNIFVVFREYACGDTADIVRAFSSTAQAEKFVNEERLREAAGGSRVAGLLDENGDEWEEWDVNVNYNIVTLETDN